jgi:hypothetical protein
VALKGFLNILTKYLALPLPSPAAPSCKPSDNELAGFHNQDRVIAETATKYR